MKITLHIPISPTKAFFSQVQWLRRSLDVLGEPYSTAKLYIAVSRDYQGQLNNCLASFEDLQEHRERYLICPVDSSRFSKFHYLETASFRYLMLDDSQITIFCDADILFLERFDELLQRTLDQATISGVIARGSPFNQGAAALKSRVARLSNDEWWNALFNRLLDSLAPLVHQYLRQTSQKCPLYFNAGFVIGKTSTWKSIAQYAYYILEELIVELIALRRPGSALSVQYAFQIALTLALYKFEIPVQPLSPAYNAWNGPEFLGAVGISKRDVKVVHYYADQLMNFYKTMPFEAMIARVQKEKILDPISTLLIERVNYIRETLN